MQCMYIPTWFDFHCFNVVCLLATHLFHFLFVFYWQCCLSIGYALISFYFYFIVRNTHVPASDSFETVVVAMYVVVYVYGCRAMLALCLSCLKIQNPLFSVTVTLFATIFVIVILRKFHGRMKGNFKYF